VLGVLACMQTSAVSGDEADEADSDASDSTKQALTAEELAKLKQNPVSGLRQLGLQALVNPNTPESGDTEASYSVQPVFPFSLSENWKVITYTILPVIHLPGLNGQHDVTGLGDTLLNFYVAPKKQGELIWGIGPAILVPTRTDPALGSDRWALGPAGILFYAKDAWSAGVVLQNIWSLGGSGTNEVNAFGAQYIFNYNLADGWFLYSNATITANWRVDSDDRWTVPVGGGVGKIFKLGDQSVSLSGQVFYNVVTPSDGPHATAIVQFALLFP
jgi:hypothetical protein